jgi:SagB-type dehydrogenase family enzyme
MKWALVACVAVCCLLGSCRADSPGKYIDLPEPNLSGSTVEDAIGERRSVRTYSEGSLTMLELSQLLFAAQGVTGERGGRALRSAPSAGGTYPIEVYVFANRVESLDKGIYRYVPGSHTIELLKGGAYGDSLAGACLGQSMPRTCAVSLVLTAVPQRTAARYGDRAMRYVLMEAGHVSQNVLLESTSLGLGAVPVGAFDDGRLNRLIGVDGETEVALYVNSIGRPVKERSEPQ